jgi:intein/homing endonuclease
MIDTWGDHHEIHRRALRGLDRILSTDRAGVAESAALDLGSAPKGIWERAVVGTEPGQPILVERQDLKPPRLYYIVPYIDGEGNVPLLAHVDADESGELAGVVAAPEGTTHFRDALTRQEVIERFAGRDVEVGERTVSLEAEQLYEHLVWQPCKESLSPFWPFYRFDVGEAGEENRVYIRIDGQVFTALHVGMGM